MSVVDLVVDIVVLKQYLLYQQSVLQVEPGERILQPVSGQLLDPFQTVAQGVAMDTQCSSALLLVAEMVQVVGQSFLQGQGAGVPGETEAAQLLLAELGQQIALGDGGKEAGDPQLLIEKQSLMLVLHGELDGLTACSTAPER